MKKVKRKNLRVRAAEIQFPAYGRMDAMIPGLLDAWVNRTMEIWHQKPGIWITAQLGTKKRVLN